MQGAWVQLLDKEEVLHALCCSQKIKILLLFKVISFLLSLKKKGLLFLFFGYTVVSDSLQPHGLQHTRLPCSSPTPRACPSSCLLSWWCHPTISSSVVPFFSCLQTCLSNSTTTTNTCRAQPETPGYIKGWRKFHRPRGNMLIALLSKMGCKKCGARISSKLSSAFSFFFF